MQVRGSVTDVGAVETVDTRYGERDCLEVGVRTDAGEATLSLWGDWAETATYLESGMEVLVTAAAERDGGDRRRYATTGDSFVVVEPGFLVDVTAVRSWVQCPRLQYLNKLSGVPLAEPVTKGTIVHDVFGDLLAGRDLDTAVEDRVGDAALELGLLDVDIDALATEVTDHATAIQRWLDQGTLTGDDAWRSEQTLLSPLFGLKGRVDAVRRGAPVELKTGKNTKRSPRFHDKVQAACYALLLGEREATDSDAIAEAAPDTGTLLYTKNAAIDRADADGDLSPAKDFSIGKGLLEFVLRERNHLAAIESQAAIPTGYEGDAICEYCFEQDTCLVVSGRLDQESKAGQLGAALPEPDREYVDQWYERIERERRAVHAEYRKLWEQTPEQRAEDDRALIDLDPTTKDQIEDGRWRLVATRSAGTPSKLRVGDTVLASEGDPVAGPATRARITALDDERVSVVADEPLALCRVDVYPSEFGVDRMLTALHDAILKGDDRTRDILFGRADPAFDPVEETFIKNNPAQDRAVRTAVGARDLALIHGPPGTGKTYVIAHIVAALVARGDRVLLSAFTNRAVDNALDALRAQDVTDIVRVGSETGVRGDMQDLRLEVAADGAAQALQSGAVVAATTAACGSRTLRSQSFDVAVVDEASQLSEPDALTALARADRVVLVGDHEQLPPVVHTDGMDRSLFERLVDEQPEAAVLLDRQYRMAQRVQAFPSREFYAGDLRPASRTVAQRSPTDLTDDGALPHPLDDPVSFHHVDGDDREHVDTAERARVADLVETYLDAGVAADGIGVIAPYRAQVAALGQALPDEVTVDTVDRFQGSAADIIIVSFVASTDLDSPIFEDTRRLNVALTRARHGLVLVGDEAVLRTRGLYDRMLDWATHAD
ncbi:MAG: AAA domain-containing protein [Halobacteriaceae archaeon]